MSQEVYAIVDLDGYVSQMRETAAKTISDICDSSLDDFISINQMINIVNKECLGFDGENRPLLDEDTNGKIFDYIAVWMHNVGLARLASQDLIECAWDNELNEMVFWAKEKPTNDTKRKSRRQNKKNQG